MKPLLLAIFISILPIICLSQDYIHKMDGTVQEGKVIEVTIDVVKYYQLELPKGPVFEMLKADIHKIRFNNGYVRIINKKKTNDQMEEEYAQDSSESSLSIGDKYQGGIVCYLDSTELHGLILAQNNIITLVKWSNVCSKSGAVYKHDGLRNTNLILQNMFNNGFKPQKTAAYICDNYSIFGHSDWYLPAINEWIILVESLSVSGETFVGGQYWSSTEKSWDKAYIMMFDGGGYYTETGNKYYDKFNVRCIRKF